MSRGVIASAAVILGVVAASCSKPYEGPVNLETSYGPVAHDGYLSRFVMVFSGNRMPGGVSGLTVSCTDPAVCRAQSSRADRWPIADIIPIGPGQSEVVFTYFHPGRKRTEEHRATVTVAHMPKVARVLVGEPVPSAALVDLPPAPGRPALRCSARAHVVSGISTTADSQVWSCERGLEVEPGVWRHKGACSGLCPDATPEWSLVACLTMREGKVASIVTFEELPDGSGDLRELHREGPKVAGECVLR